MKDKVKQYLKEARKIIDAQKEALNKLEESLEPEIKPNRIVIKEFTFRFDCETYINKIPIGQKLLVHWRAKKNQPYENYVYVEFIPMGWLKWLPKETILECTEKIA